MRMLAAVARWLASPKRALALVGAGTTLLTLARVLVLGSGHVVAPVVEYFAERFPSLYEVVVASDDASSSARISRKYRNVRSVRLVLPAPPSAAATKQAPRFPRIRA